jgi:Tol biopolymer transport system component
MAGVGLACALVACGAAVVATAAPPTAPPSIAATATTTSKAIPAGLFVFNLRKGDVTSMNVASVRTNGTGFRRLTDDPQLFADDPAWDPARQRLLYGNDSASGGNIYAMSLDGVQGDRLTSGTLHDGAPSVTPDGRMIAFDRGADGVRSTIWLVQSDGSSATQLTTPPAKGIGPGDVQPSISPDGRQIAFVRDGAIDLVAIGGGDVRELVPASYQAERPRWSPNGRRIVFGGNDDGTSFLVDADGSTPPRTINPVGWLVFEPSFSPDGGWLVATFFFKDNGYSGIGVMPVDGSSPTMIKVMDNDAEVPWAPIWIPADEVTATLP